MTGHIGKKTNRFRDVVGAKTQAEREDQWGEMPGRVVSFNAENQTATIQPLYKKRLNGEPTSLPELLEVPVRFQRMGGFVVTTPVKPDDLVTLRPQMRNSENYHESGGEYAAADTRSNSLSDYEAFLDGGEPLAKPIPKFNNTNLEIRSEDGQFAMEMSEDGKFRLRGAQGDWFALLHELLTLLASDTLIIKYGSSKGNGHQLEHQAAYAALRDKFGGMMLG